MSTHGVPLDKAELLSVLLEGLLYGFSLPMFGGTIWALTSQRSTHQVNRKMLMVACLLLLCSTMHFVIDIMRIMEGLILFQDTFPGGPIMYFADVSQWTFLSKNYVYAVQTLVGDGVVLYRCYAVWQSKLVMIFPVLLWCAVGASGIGCAYAASKLGQNDDFGGSLSRWITSFWTLTLTTNLLTTLLLAYRIWYVDRKAGTRLRGQLERKSQLRPLLHIIVDAGVIYSLTLFAALICFVNHSNGQYVILDMITPIISIAFYMTITRVGLANRANQQTNRLSAGYTSTVGNNLVSDRRSMTQVHVTFTENNVDNDQRLPMSPITPAGSENNHPSKIEFDGVGEAV